MIERISSLDDGYEPGDLSVFPEALDDKNTLYEARNNAQTTLKQSLTYAGKSIIVKDASGFPPKGLLRLGPPPGTSGSNEIIYYDSKQGNIFKDLIRGYLNTRQNFWNSDTTWVFNGVMADHHNSVKDAILQIEKTVGTSKNPEDDSIVGRLKTLEDKHLAPRALFRAFPKSGPPPLTVSFHNFSEGHVIRFLWDFGDGSQSVERNPIHTYTQEGEYTVKLDAITSEGGRGITEKKNYIIVDADTSMPFFYSTPVESEDKTFEFIDQSYGDITQRVWIFDDGNTATVTDPDIHTIKHTYQNPGQYNPSLLLFFSGQRVKRVFITEILEIE